MNFGGEMVCELWVWNLRLEGEVGKKEMKKIELPKADLTYEQ